ncbi:uncharacterized protein [Onthophagus taurus]|uniref:uncharacterized protein n=1 Tax=Onthophagus taurus TaxID=166361 RepID=UPI0039BE035C
MSPASSGVLEVEKYIGACLISSNNNHHGSGRKKYSTGGEKKNFERYQRCPDVFGGIPLVYPTSSAGRNTNTRSKSSVLAVHGVPLILNTNPTSNVPQQSYRKNRKENYCNSLKQDSNNNNNSGGMDSLSVTSDSSSTSSSSVNASSDNTCLPRIIKPRKRRKKDRKPHVFNGPFIQSTPVSTQTRIMPYFLQAPIYSIYHHHHQNSTSMGGPPFVFEEREEVPNLQHSFDDLDDFDLNGNQSEPTSSTCCQCKYCEPVGIWDFFGSEIKNDDFNKIDDFNKSDYLLKDNKEVWEKQYDKYCSYRRLESSVSVDSQSSLVDSLSSLSLDDGVTSPSSSPRVSRDLEVSTEIVTSMNGQHRDLEIKFFSTVVQEIK